MEGTGMSVKERMKMFEKQKNSEDVKEKAKDSVQTGVSVRDRLAGLQASEPKRPAYVPSSATKPKEQPLAAPGLMPSAPEPSSVSANVPAVKAEPAPTLSVKERMALLQQNSKLATEPKKPSQEIAAGSLLADRISQLKDSSTKPIVSRPEIPARMSLTSSEKPDELDPKPGRNTVNFGEGSNKNEEFKKKMEGMVFRMPSDLTSAPARVFRSEPEPVEEREVDPALALVHAEMVKPVRKRNPVKLNTDFDFDS
jgi:hypothetical protein